MANFKKFTKEMNNNIKKMANYTKGFFYTLDVNSDELWNHWLDSFPNGTNNIFREKREYECSCCKSFIKNFGSVVYLKNGNLKTIWDFETEYPYDKTNKMMLEYLKDKKIKDIYVPNINLIGTPVSNEIIDGDVPTIRKWNHLYCEIPDTYILKFNRNFKVNRTETKSEIIGRIRDDKSVFLRSLTEISLDSIITVLELISSGSIYRGDEWFNNLKIFRELKEEFDSISDPIKRDNFAWEKSAKHGPAISRIKNHSMGTLLMDITEGKDLDSAVKSWENMVAGPNYKRPKPIFTKKMLENAKKELAELGYIESLKRRFATLDDISINDIIFADKSISKRIKDSIDVFDEMSSEIPINPKTFSKVKEISIDKFITDVLPTVNKIELFLDNKLNKNMVSLIAPENIDSKSIFKWSNAFSWAYTGNITDSNIKNNVKAAGGNVTGDLRVSIQWNDEPDVWDKDDKDLHCKESTEYGNYEIYYGNRTSLSPNKGRLDVDIINPNKNEPAVENIYYLNKNEMSDGVYSFFTNQYTNRGGKGFKAEVEFDGNIYNFEYPHSMPSGKDVAICDITVKNGNFTIVEKLKSTITSKKIWNLETMQWHPVTTIMYSPNYWNDSDKIGNKHIFFMLDNAINNENPNGFYNEFLIEELNKHKHVMEALGEKLSVVDAEDQLSGVGFSSTIKNDVILKVTGKTTRILKVTF